jgi:hypothetical protein
VLVCAKPPPKDFLKFSEEEVIREPDDAE